ncbi:STAS domain-containing protein, partial [Streptomyces anulatus]
MTSARRGSHAGENGSAPGQCLVVDLAGLRFCDSTGISTLLAARRHAHA